MEVLVFDVIPKWREFELNAYVTKAIPRTLVALSLLLGMASANANFTLPDELNTRDEIVWQSIVDGTFTSNDSHSWVQGSMMPKGSDPGSNFLCANFDDANCQGKDAIIGQLILSPCTNLVTTGCIESLSVGKDSANLKSATLEFEATSQRISSSPVAGIPGGGSVSLWSSDELGTYLVVASIEYQKLKNISPFVSNFSVNLIPTQATTDARYLAPVSSQVSQNGRPNVAFDFPASVRTSGVETRNCLVITDGYCFTREDFDGEVRAKVVLRVPNTVTGWLFGRMKQPLIEVSKIDAKNNRLSVEATSTTVPNLFATFPEASVKSDPGILSWAQSFFREGDGELEKRLTETGGWGGSSSGADKLEIFRWWGERLKTYGGPDVRFATSTRWMFGSTSMGNYSDDCFADKTRLTGLVTTNAPFYESGPPKMSKGALNYVVAGPHHLADGTTLFRGVYDLAIRSDAARCIYEFTDAPLRAEITVSSADGTIQDISTESMTERDGWIRLGAYNFTFSEPTVKVKFTQTLKKSSKKSVTCVKGKLKKKFAASVCPKGYKKA